MKSGFLVSGVCGFLAVLLGAFGAHALEGRFDARAIEIWQTANRYHFFHALGLLGLDLGRTLGLEGSEWARWAWLLGLALFSGSLYLYTLSGLKLFAMLAPLGGLALCLGWLFLVRLKKVD